MNLTKRTLSSLSVIAMIFMVACAKERPVKDIIPNGKRLTKDNFTGQYLYQKTLADIQYASRAFSDLPTGYYLQSEKLVEFQINEKTLDVISIDPLFRNDRAARQSSTLASFPIKHVDVLRKQNADGEDTHEVEETETRRPWQEREYIVIDPTGDTQDEFKEDSATASTPDTIDIDKNAGAINLKVSRSLKDNTQLSVRYSFLKFNPNPNYEQREYPIDMRTKFGYFPTVTYQFDKYGRITHSDTKIFMNRWDTTKKITYYLSKGYPEHLKAATREVVASWNDAFKAATGKDVVELKENSGQEIGDLRYSMLIYDPTPDTAHGILGYGPSIANPRTGEIIKADVILYGGALKSTVYRERIWELQLGDFNPAPAPAGARPMVARRPVPAPAPAPRNRISDLLEGKGMTVRQAPKLETGLFENLRRDYRVEKIVEKAKSESFAARIAKTLKKGTADELKQNFTEIDAEVSAAIRSEDFKRLSDDELEIAIFKPLLVHEMGHNFGLRHNFMGSFDGRHFENGTKSSSVMDYGWLTTHEPPTPGQYDRAALMIAYSTDSDKKAALMADNYYYCSDEHTMSSDHMACNRFDAGITLNKVAEALGRRYDAAWLFNNLRLDRVHMSSTSEYINKVSMALAQLRMMYDHAQTVINVMENVNPRDARSFQNSMVSLWRLAHQRLEADTQSKKENIIPIRVPTKLQVQVADGKLAVKNEFVERKIDISKALAILADARAAKDSAFQTLAGILFDENRPLYSSGDLIEGETQIRGIIFDKLLSLMYLSTGTPDPLGRGTVINVYNSESSGVMRDIVASLLSNTAFFPGGDFNGYDVNIREFAFGLYARELAQSSGTELSRKLIGIQKVTLAPDSQELKDLMQHRKVRQEILQALILNKLTPEEKAKKEQELDALQLRISADKGAVISATGEANEYLRATVEPQELNFATASGLLIQQNLNPMEDVLAAFLSAREVVRKELAAEQAKPKTDPATIGNPLLPPGFANPFVELQDPKKIEALEKQIAEFTDSMGSINSAIAHFQKTLDRFHKFYEFGILENSNLL